MLPILDEAPRVAAAIRRAHAMAGQVVVVDGGSRDDSLSLAQAAAPRAIAIAAPRGRASQMNAGARRCGGDILVFLHADVEPPADAARAIVDAVDRGARWGRFDVRLVPSTPLLRLVSAMMNRRSRLTGIATGDQVMFVTRAAFDAVGGFPALELMEDIELSTRLRRSAGRPACLPGPVHVDARRWHRDGVLRTIVSMWWIRLLYWLGADHRALRDRYYGTRTCRSGRR
ncbi:MAG: TIGR04283 family arsenosugar biosynthesis glycosyltransferase [Lautropia sp.]